MRTKDTVNMEEIKSLISEVERTKEYNRNVISEYHDRIFGKNDRPDSPEPCPIMQMRKIKAWYQDQNKDR